MNGWFIAYLILVTLGLGTDMAKHGQPREGQHNFWVALISVIITTIIIYNAIKLGL
jgi:hypothetical protein